MNKKFIKAFKQGSRNPLFNSKIAILIVLLIALIKHDTAMMEVLSSLVKFLTALVELANSIITITS